MMVEVYDADDMTQLHNLSKQELVGSYSFMLHKLAAAPGQEITTGLANPIRKNCGNVKIMCEEKKADFGQYSC